MGLVLSYPRGRDIHEEQRAVPCRGRHEASAQAVQQKLQETMDHTAANTAMTMVVALSYSSRWEITEAARAIAQKVKEGVLDPAEISEETVEKHLATAFMPDPDLLSYAPAAGSAHKHHLLWQIAYSELLLLRHLLARLLRKPTSKKYHPRFPKPSATVRKEQKHRWRTKPPLLPRRPIKPPERRPLKAWQGLEADGEGQERPVKSLLMQPCPRPVRLEKNIIKI